MAKNETSFQPGQSGNPKGRPPKSRTLTALLARGGGRKIPRKDGKEIPARQMFVQKLWDGLATGIIKFDDTEIKLGIDDYLALARLVFGQIDGPPPAAVDVTSDGQPVKIAIIEVNKHHAGDLPEDTE